MNKSVAIIVQARIGSRRFPYKTIKKLGNYRVIEWVIRRLKKSKKSKQIILATTRNSEDKKLIKIANENNIQSFQGSTNNVLKRFYDVSKKFKLKNIVRVCADRPFISPSEIDLLINSYFKGGRKYTFNDRNFKKLKYADGFGAEIFSFKELEFLYNNAYLPKHLEHVTTYFWDNFSEKSLVPARSNIPKAKRYLRSAIDTEKDFNIINNFIKKFTININTKTKDIVDNLHKYKASKELLIKKN